MYLSDKPIVIFGAGIAGLWLFHRLRRLGYHTILLESKGIGGGQSLSSQGIIHSGMKYAFGGIWDKDIRALISILSQMPDRWEKSLKIGDEVDLSTMLSTKISTDSVSDPLVGTNQYLLLPSGISGWVLGPVIKVMLGGSVRKIRHDNWFKGLSENGFKGEVIAMKEPVLNIADVVEALAAPYRDYIYQIDWPNGIEFSQSAACGRIETIKIGKSQQINPSHVIFTAAHGNAEAAQILGHMKDVKIQRRPLLMVMMKKAPFAVHAHCIGFSEKPAMTITTHRSDDGDLVWYLGGAIAECPMDTKSEIVIKRAQRLIQRYFPSVDIEKSIWKTLPIERVEGVAFDKKQAKMPAQPVMQQKENIIYAWPTKLAFAPLLSDMIVKRLGLKERPMNEKHADVVRSSSGQASPLKLPKANINRPPWSFY